MLLEVDDLRAGYGGNEILHGVSLGVAGGGITGVIGPNGAGKSTLLKAVCGFAKVTGGRVRLDGDDVAGGRPDALYRRGLRYVEQGHSVFPDLTVLDNLKVASLAVRGGAPRLDEEIGRAFSRFPVLADRRRSSARQLSGGQQRMLELARALMYDPRLIILDEPSIGLAPKLVEDTYALVTELNRDQGIAFLIVEQNVSAVLSVADTCHVLDLGVLRFSGTAEELLSDGRLSALYVGAVASKED